MPLPSDPTVLHPGDIFAGKYRIERVLGRGGMGAVYAATHLDLGEMRALKRMHPEVAAHPELLERFVREARAAAKLRSEHVAKVHDVGRLDSGEPYIVLEYLEGTDLGALAKNCGPLPMAQAVDFILQACSAIAEAHGVGIVHRDIKPANLFLTRDAKGAACIKVLDFGISKIPTSSDGGNITMTHQMMGSPGYMAPEQIRSARSADARADVWALGVTLYELVTGTRAFYQPNVETLALVLEYNPPAPATVHPECPPELSDVIMLCLEKDREKRMPSIHALTRALRRFASTPTPENDATLSNAVTAIQSNRSPSGGGTFPSNPSGSGASGSGAAALVSVPSQAAPRSRAPVIAGILAVGALAAGTLVFALSRPARAPAPPTSAVGVVDRAAPSAATIDVALQGLPAASASATPSPNASVAGSPSAAPSAVTAPTATLKPTAAKPAATPSASAKAKAAASGTPSAAVAPPKAPSVPTPD